MARAVLPNRSARAKRLFAVIMDRAFHHWGQDPPGDHDLADSETDTAMPDDDDIVSPASYAQESVWPSSL